MELIHLLYVVYYIYVYRYINVNKNGCDIQNQFLRITKKKYTSTHFKIHTCCSNQNQKLRGRTKDNDDTKLIARILFYMRFAVITPFIIIYTYTKFPSISYILH